MGENVFEDHNSFRSEFDKKVKELGIKLSASDRKAIINGVSWRVETAAPVIATVHKPGKVEADPLHGRYAVSIDGKHAVVEYESDSELRDTEQVPLLENGGIEAFFRREVLPYVFDAWIDEGATKVGYEISFTRDLYESDFELRDTEQVPLLENGGIDAFFRREVLPYVFDAWIDEGATKVGYEISFTRVFYKPQPLRTLDEIRQEIEVLEKESGGPLAEIIGKQN